MSGIERRLNRPHRNPERLKEIKGNNDISIGIKHADHFRVHFNFFLTAS